MKEVTESAAAECRSIVNDYIGENAPQGADKSTTYALAEDCLTAMQKQRTGELRAAGLGTKDAEGKKDKISNRITAYKTRILKDIELSGRVEGLTVEEKKAKKEQDAAKKVADEALQKAQAEKGMRPATMAELASELMIALQTAVPTTAEWALLKHLAMRIEAGHATYTGAQAPVTRHMGDVVEVVPTLTTH